jgi:hypothetical protein
MIASPLSPLRMPDRNCGRCRCRRSVTLQAHPASPADSFRNPFRNIAISSPVADQSVSQVLQ